MDTPHLSSDIKFMNELRYHLLEGLPMQYSHHLYTPDKVVTFNPNRSQQMNHYQHLRKHQQQVARYAPKQEEKQVFNPNPVTWSFVFGIATTLAFLILYALLK